MIDTSTRTKVHPTWVYGVYSHVYSITDLLPTVTLGAPNSAQQKPRPPLLSTRFAWMKLLCHPLCPAPGATSASSHMTHGQLVHLQMTLLVKRQFGAQS